MKKITMIFIGGALTLSMATGCNDASRNGRDGLNRNTEQQNNGNNNYNDRNNTPDKNIDPNNTPDNQNMNNETRETPEGK